MYTVDYKTQTDERIKICIITCLKIDAIDHLNKGN